MPPILLSPTFWKFAGGLLLAVVIVIATGLAIHHYQFLKSQAALVPQLQSANASLKAQASRDDSRASKAAIDLVAAYAKRDQAVADMQRWHAFAGQIGATLQGLASNANATKIPLCLPTDAERELFNAQIARLIHPDAGAGQAGASGQVPAGTDAVH